MLIESRFPTRMWRDTWFAFRLRLSATRAAAEALVQTRIAQLKRLAFSDIAALPATHSEPVIAASQQCALVVCVQQLPSGRLLVRVHVKRRSLFRPAVVQAERGLLFSTAGYVREITSAEIAEAPNGNGGNIR